MRWSKNRPESSSEQNHKKILVSKEIKAVKTEKSIYKKNIAIKYSLFAVRLKVSRDYVYSINREINRNLNLKIDYK